MGNKGGARAGSGRPAVQPGGAVQKSMSLRDSDVEIFKMLGDGQMSAGARRAADISRMVVENAILLLDALFIFDQEIGGSNHVLYEALKELKHDLETISNKPGESGLEDSPVDTEQEKAIA